MSKKAYMLLEKMMAAPILTGGFLFWRYPKRLDSHVGDLMNIPADTKEFDPTLSDALTPVELACLRMTAEGLDQETIAKRLGVEIWEIEMLFYSAAHKLKAENRMHAVCLAAANGLF